MRLVCVEDDDGLERSVEVRKVFDDRVRSVLGGRKRLESGRVTVQPVGHVCRIWVKLLSNWGSVLVNGEESEKVSKRGFRLDATDRRRERADHGRLGGEEDDLVELGQVPEIRRV
jgi:glutamate dehydrogenase/leucine dehydrogenase